MSGNSSKQRGTLKIFLGYGDCSGKTVAMLEAAKEVRQLGEDVVIGSVCLYEKEDKKKQQEIPLLSSDSICFKGEEVPVFDIESAIKRKPSIIVLDEMNHENSFGERHKHRYQDILELLDSGICVYTTLNIGELESYHDIIKDLFSIPVTHTVPDFIFDNAEEIQFVDIEPSNLFRRMEEKDLVQRSHYSVDILKSLRKMAYRRCEDKLEKGIYETNHVVKNKKNFHEHILVCISSAPSNAKVIRTAARIAKAFHGPFTAIYVQTSSKNVKREQKQDVNENIKLAQQLGAKVVTTYGNNIAYQISEYARINNVSKIVLGKTAIKRSIVPVKKTMVDEISMIAPEIDIYIIPDIKSPTKPREKVRQEWKLPNIKDIGRMFGVIGIVTAFSFFLYHFNFGSSNILIGYFIAVFIISAKTRGNVVGILSSFISIALYTKLLPAVNGWKEMESKNIMVTAILMIGMVIVINYYKQKLVEQSEQAVNTFRRTEVLFKTSKLLRQTSTIEEVLEATAEQLKGLLQCSILCHTKWDGKISEPVLYVYQDKKSSFSDEASKTYERKAVEWVFEHRHVAGCFTDTFSLAKAIYFPLYNNEMVFAVMGIVLEDRKQLDSFEKNVIKSVLTEVSFVIEKIILNEKQEEILIQTEKEKLKSNLLRSISHDLRTPLAGITGSASFLLESYELLDKESKESLIKEILKDSMWMGQLVNNLLNMTRIQEGRLLLKSQLEVVDDIISESITRVESRLGNREVKVSIPEELLLIPMDAQLIIQVIVNFLDNAIKHTKEDGIIKIKVYQVEKEGCNSYAKFEIIDNGTGIEESILETMFESFVTEQKGVTDSSRGIGLGLSICKSVIQAHKGEIGAYNTTQGATCYFMLPLELEGNRDE